MEEKVSFLVSKNSNLKLSESSEVLFFAFCLKWHKRAYNQADKQGLNLCYIIIIVVHEFCCLESVLQVAVAVLVSWSIFRNPISSMNAVGCGVTLVGCTFYGYVRQKLSQQSSATPRSPRTPRNRLELLPLVNDKAGDKV